ncbi:MAG: DUF5606 domain-containing protein [Bacteroidales bacterium]|nr:DUF5606 domain-containing protein [Bacteroidales bacterium]
MEKTDLKKVLSVSGQPGLWLYLAQAKNGVIVESLVTKHRTQFGSNARITTLEDVSIYTNSGEVTLKQVFLDMKAKLGAGQAPSSKTDDKAIKAFFGEVIPDYDQDKFYVSHMKKVLDWYNVLNEFATIDFVEEEEEKSEDVKQETEAPKEAAKKPAAKKETTKAKAAAGTKAASKATSAKSSTTKSAAPKKATRSAHIKAN